MLLTAIRYIILEVCIEIVFNKICTNFYEIKGKKRERLIQDYYRVWVNYCNVVGVKASGMSDFIETIGNVSEFGIIREMRLLELAAEIHRKH